MTYSVDLRQRVVAFVEAGRAKAEAARRFSVSEGSVHNWLKRDNLAPTKVKHRDRKLNWKALEQHIKDEPDAKLKDRAEHFGVHTTAIWYAIKQINITRKSGATPLVFNEPGNAHQDKTAKVSRAQSSRETKVSPTITTDRSTTGKPQFNLQDTNVASDNRIYQNYGYAKRGKKIYGSRTGKRTARENLIAARRNRELLAPMLIQGSVNAMGFEQWLEQWLCRELHPRSTLIVCSSNICKFFEAIALAFSPKFKQLRM